MDGPSEAERTVTIDEDELRRLRESEERFRTLCEHAPVMIDAFDDAGRCLLWNRECERRLGYTLAEVEALRDPFALFYPDPRTQEKVLEALRRADGRFYEYRVTARDGSERTQLWANFRLPSGTTISVGHDVTERRSVEEQLRQSQKMEALGQLTGGIAHDLNNLLTVITANAELLAQPEPGLPADGQAVAVAHIREAADRGAQLLRRLLAFSRRQRLRLEPVDLSTLLEELVPTLQRVVPETVHIRLRHRATRHHVRADSLAVEQIVVNLVTNARDAMAGDGTIDLVIQDLVSGSDPYVALDVVDHGEGMDEETLRRALEPFFTTKPSGRGTGLGLAMVYGLVEQHGGMLQLESEPGRGSRARVMLPVCDEPARHQAPLAAQLPRGTEKILVVEDQDLVREATSQMLRQLGYRVLEAHDGLDALSILGTEDVALVLSDVVMPRLSGGELWERLRHRAAAPPFVFMSGYAPEHAGLPEHRLPLLQKPWTAEDLARTVRRVLDGSD